VCGLDVSIYAVGPPGDLSGAFRGGTVIMQEIQQRQDGVMKKK
jgi:hypothetical protein